MLHRSSRKWIRFGCSALLFAFGGLLGTNTAAAAPCGTVPGNLVLNCGFETGDFTNWTLSGNLQGGPAPNNFYGVDTSQPNSGTFAGYFGVQGGGGTAIGTVGPFLALTQTLNLLPAEYYQIGFALSQNAPTAAPGSVSYFDARFGGVIRFSELNPPNSGGYQDFAITVSTPVSASASANTLLQFDFQNDSDFFSFDDVVVTAIGPVPEPASLSLIAPALVGLCLLRRRRQSLR